MYDVYINMVKITTTFQNLKIYSENFFFSLSE